MSLAQDTNRDKRNP